ncbi:MAG: 30S ribosomal protein S16 [Clostridia bacterium]
MVKLRLKRMGAKKRPTYRIIASDSRNKRDGRFNELIGTYTPLEEVKFNINEEVALKWLRVGALPTDTVKNIFSDAGITEKFLKEKMSK